MRRRPPSTLEFAIVMIGGGIIIGLLVVDIVTAISSGGSGYFTQVFDGLVRYISVMP